uniref:NADH-ubiquinone oxidoreductase chain 2 n=1 Tax=Bombus pratorum TaxID=30194 RepID=A0A0S2LUF8_BOMPR|nr:NADH dehydrogenase subunit 2 [Bombus pratorum]DBA43949.1 TPA_asm: ND2 [Bombus pratorum]
MFYNKMYILSFILVMILFFFLMNSTSIYIKWLSMEFSTITMISMINIKSNNKIISILYFIMSSISSLIIITIISLNLTQLFFLKNNLMNFLLNLSMFLKIGMFPFCFWMIYIYNLSSWNQILIISTFMKFIPIYFFSSMIYLTPKFIIMLFINNTFIALYTNINFSIKKLFGCSSIFNSMFFILMLYSNKNLFILLMLIYLMTFSSLIYFLNYYNINNLNFSNFSSYSYYMFIMLLFMYSSFPLYLTFLFKWEFIYYFNLNFNNNLIILLLLISMIMLWNYFILLKYMMLKLKFLKTKLNFEIFYMKNYILMMILFFSSMFILYNLI